LNILDISVIGPINELAIDEEAGVELGFPFVCGSVEFVREDGRHDE
jgi:hypothetical protein